MSGLAKMFRGKLCLSADGDLMRCWWRLDKAMQDIKLFRARQRLVQILKAREAE